MRLADAVYIAVYFIVAVIVTAGVVMLMVAISTGFTGAGIHVDLSPSISLAVLVFTVLGIVVVIAILFDYVMRIIRPAPEEEYTI